MMSATKWLTALAAAAFLADACSAYYMAGIVGFFTAFLFLPPVAAIILAATRRSGSRSASLLDWLLAILMLFEVAYAAAFVRF